MQGMCPLSGALNKIFSVIAQPDKYFNGTSLSVTALVQAAGSALAAVDAVMEGPTAGKPRGFAVIRLPGHHATRNAPMGFCIFNNVAIAARYAQQKHRLQKVCTFSIINVIVREDLEL